MITTRRHVIAAAACLSLALGTSPEVRAESPTDALRDFFTRVNTVLADPETEGQPAERLIAVRQLVKGVFDFRAAAELALGDEWRARTPAEREEFAWLFADLLERAYVLRIASRADLNAGVQIRYLGESIDRNAATARTTVASRDGGEIPLDYRMTQRGERWMVDDVAIGGVSVVANYRAQFRRIIESASYQELVALMQAKTGDAPRVSAAAAAAAPGEPVVRRPSRTEDNQPPAPRAGRVEFDAADVAGDTRAAAGPGLDARQVDEGTGERVAAVRAAGYPPSPTSQAPAAAASYWVQVGAFKSPDAVGWLAARLHEQNLVLSHGPALVLRVRVGPFSDRAKALSKLLELRAKGYQPFIAEGRE